MGRSPGLACAIEKSRRARPELVERGRLKKLSRHGPGFRERIGNSQPRNILRWDCLRVTFSRPRSTSSGQALRDFSPLESLPRTASWGSSFYIFWSCELAGGSILPYLDQRTGLAVPAPDFSPGERVFKPARTFRYINSGL
jgi:hypothetical protein